MGVFAMGQGGSVWGRGFHVGQRIPYRMGVFAMGQGGSMWGRGSPTPLWGPDPHVCPPGVDVWNPAFDVTPHELITGGIVTEFGVFRPEELRQALEGR